MANRKRVIYQSEALFVSATGSNFKYITGAWDTGLYNAGTATAANRHNTLFNTFDFSSISQTGTGNINVINGFYNAFFTGTFTSGAFSSGLLNFANQVNRVQSANYGFEIVRQDVNQFGQLAAIDRIIIEQPTVSLDFSYYLNSGENENNLGLNCKDGTTSALANILTGDVGTKNYYILVSPEGTDANIDTGIAIAQGKTIGLGNAFLSSYSVEAAVGGIPTVTVNAEALNMRFYGASTGNLPTVNPVDGTSLVGTFSIPTPVTGAGFSALRPGDVTVDITSSNVKGATVTDLKVQNATISFDITRDPIQKLGNKFAFTREITFPLTITMSMDAVLGDIDAGNLADIVNDDSSSFDVSMTLNKPGSTNRSVKYTVKGAKLDSQSFSSAIGENKTVSLQFTSQVGGPTDTTRGIFIQGP